MVFPRPSFNWQEDDIKLLHNSWQSTMQLLSEYSPITSEKYMDCLKKGREAIIEKMIELILAITYIKPPDESESFSLNWKDAPNFMAKFLQQLETVFTGDKEIKIRKKILAPAVGVAISAVVNVSVPTPTKYWKKDDIQTLYNECQSAMELLEKNPAIISEKYKQCLQKGRDIIMKTMMDFIMDPVNFPKDSVSSEYMMKWERAPEALATILHYSETVFTRDEELQIREKRKDEIEQAPSLW